MLTEELTLAQVIKKIYAFIYVFNKMLTAYLTTPSIGSNSRINELNKAVVA